MSYQHPVAEGPLCATYNRHEGGRLTCEVVWAQLSRGSLRTLRIAKTVHKAALGVGHKSTPEIKLAGESQFTICLHGQTVPPAKVSSRGDGRTLTTPPNVANTAIRFGHLQPAWPSQTQGKTAVTPANYRVPVHCL
ncbi:hypothetical protein E2C01_046262 [Portunus trituberculatus]|uniref:Uncharacterized protein n=1 Tax=Portunus trituberculatus TaxID=210409 RepID=A0A5B7G7A3_PORTR|nr:hypothetical protein [Portunus trituberculatus]